MSSKWIGDLLLEFVPPCMSSNKMGHKVWMINGDFPVWPGLYIRPPKVFTQRSIACGRRKEVLDGVFYGLFLPGHVLLLDPVLLDIGL